MEAVVSVLAPVAHPFQTLTNGSPVSPNSVHQRIGVTSVPAAGWKANVTSC